jgi:predicted alpha/beta-fold hydrolase
MLAGRMLHGHYWTLQNWAAQNWARQWTARQHRSRANPAQVTPERPWARTVRDPKLGELQLSGRWHAQAHSDELLLVVHGLGGSSESSYTRVFFRAIFVIDHAVSRFCDIERNGLNLC